MAQQQGKSSVLAKLGNRFDKTVQDHRDDAVVVGGQRVPPNITNGVARLSRCYFDTYKKGDNIGKPYLRMQGTVVEPKTHVYGGNVISTEGAQTSTMFAICATKNQRGEVTSEDANIQKAMNAMKAIGGEDFLSDLTSLQQLETVYAPRLEAAKPYFRFSTRERLDQKTNKPTGDSWEDWYGYIEGYAPPADDSVDDGTGGPAPTAPRGRGPSTNGSTDYNADGAEDLDALVEAANAPPDENNPAQKQLEEIAEAAGCDMDKIAKAPSWEAVKNMILKARGPDDAGGNDAGGDADDANGWAPTKGGTCMYAPPHPRKKGQKLKDVECDVISVDDRKGVATIRSLEDQTTYKGIALDELTEPR